MARLILSIDGGGVRGVLAARLLARLDEAHPRWRQHVQLHAGTSTGALIAACLADGLAPARVVELYRAHAQEIFDDSWFDDVLDLGKAVGADYKLKGLLHVLRGLFGARTLADLPGRVLIPSVLLDGQVEHHGRSLRRFKPKFFHNFPGPDSDGAEKIADVLARSAAAPTYFPSHQGYIDGGIVANNPSVCALAQCLSASGGDCDLRELHVLSVGTGLDELYVDAGRSGSLDWGWGQWARPLVGLMLDGVMGTADYQCRQLLGARYLRVDCVLEGRVAMDDARERTIDDLVRQADGVDLSGAVRWLKKFA
jgi:patatin-like phospholipase/acyl hydrolase